MFSRKTTFAPSAQSKKEELGSEEVGNLNLAASPRTLVYSAVNFIVASVVYWHLIKGGWLRNRYELSDPNIVNLVLAIFEPIAVLGVVAFWIWRTASLRRLLGILCVAQIVIALGFLVFFLVFAATFRFKLM